jgi:N-acetylglucosamine-6-phosphate deacetylase
MTSFSAARVLTPTGWIGPSLVHCSDGRIDAVEPTTGEVEPVVIVPGFIDLQVNGIDDVDVASARGADWDRLDGLLLAQGVTTWCPTLVTSPLPWYERALDRIATAQARPAAPRPELVGAHLEGPFLGGAPGAHRVEHLAEIDLDWLRGLPDTVRMMTLAPEQRHAAEAVRLLRDRGILVSLGHTTATADEFAAAVDAGASMVTHLFNAMTGLHHREPGVAAAALTTPGLGASIIADGVHVHPTMLRLAFQVLGDRAVLVTDAVAWRAGSVGPVGLALVDGAPRLPNGTLAGSAVTMDESIRVMVRSAGVDLAAAVGAASTTPARLLGLFDRGSIEPGLRADLVALGEDLEVVRTWVGGVPTA